ncbi:MAG: DNA helicase Rep [Gammaproteobacteria bacterium]|nr:DNA helicase Rep [Gammaproteobacteria bacterium]MDH5650538.1 DNA helicase Rep [Gammaproteobacteria bacterium]
MSDQMNPAQRAAVRYLDTPLLVLAGAGSGKTRVITQKIAYLIEQCSVEPQHIAAVTFTNKAAREMKARVGKLLGKDKMKGLRVSTFHTMGLNIVRKELKCVGLKSGFSIYDSADSLALIKELMKKTFGDPGNQVEQVQYSISRWKNAFVLPEQAAQEAHDAHSTAAAQIYATYNHHLKTYNAVDFDDLIMLPVILFRENPDKLAAWRERIRYLLVDEYQDTNTTQYELVKQLVGVRNCLTVVGDDDQSIYSWRGANPENLALLKQDFPNLRVIKLEQNYRSTGRILRAANALISNNPHVFEKRLWSELGNGDPLRVIRCKDEEQEAEQVVHELMHHRFRHGNKFKDYAILYRGNHQSRLFERMLRQNNIPYYLSGGTSFFAYTEIKDVMAYLRMVANPDDDNAFVRIINTPRRELGPGTVEKLAGYAHMRGNSLFTSCFEIGLQQHLNQRACEKLNEFANWIVSMAHKAEEEHPIEAVKSLLLNIDYERWLLDTCKDEVIANRKMDNVKELITWLERMHKNDPSASLSDLVNKLTLIDMLKDDDEVGDQVSLMTLHAAKGLEFPHVFLVGMEEELLPHRSSIEEETIEEERRLAYVGITRAQRSLTITMAVTRKRYGEKIDCQPSRFLDELPKDDLEWAGQNVVVDEAKRQENGRSQLAMLRGLLSEG